MTQHTLQITLMSDATFGRGDGIAGLVDEEIEHDSATGLPYIRGRVLRGLLVEECANILYGYSQASDKNAKLETELVTAAQWLFGVGGSGTDNAGHLHVGRATLPDALCKAIAAQVAAQEIAPSDILESLTTIRRQSSVNDKGAPEDGSLRSMRVLLRGDDTNENAYSLSASLIFDSGPDNNALALLAACAACVHRGGTGRNRGRGRLKMALVDDKSDKSHLNVFENWLKGGRP